MALEGKIDLLPLRVAMAATMVISYISSFFFSGISKIGLVKDINWLGSTCVPSIRSAMEISSDPSQCAFVMTIQWFFVIFYGWLFFVYYWPFSTAVRVATKKWYATNALPSSNGTRCILFLFFGLASIFGDFGLLRFPTFLNGGIFAIDSGHFVTQKLVNSQLILPAFSWFSVLAYVIIYWFCTFIIANRSVLFDQKN
jgi:hypothetical protein